jgi:hypothetical protein
VLLLQEFDLHIVDRKGAENPITDNLSRLENISFDPIPVNDSFLNEQLAAIKVTSRESSWYADYDSFIVSKYLPPTFITQQRRKFFYNIMLEIELCKRFYNQVFIGLPMSKSW